MSSKDRIARQKEDTRNSILEASYAIVKEEGWNGLNMRKIADRIEYTAPIIYEYFANKDAIIKELASQSFINLHKKLILAKDKFENPKDQLKSMWMAYWDFAVENTEMYQVMYGVEMNCSGRECSTVENTYNLFITAIMEVMKDKNPSYEVVKQKYYTFYSVIHGLVSINITNKNAVSDEINIGVLNDAIGGIINTLE